MDELEVLLVHDWFKCLHITRVCESVDTDVLIVWVFVGHDVEEVTSDKSGSTGY